MVKTFPTAASIEPHPHICESDREGIDAHIGAIGDAPRNSGVAEAGLFSDYYRLRAEEAIGKDLRAKEAGGTADKRVTDLP